LPEDQIWALVAFLQAQGGEVTVTADEFSSEPAVEQGATSSSLAAASDPVELMNELGCFACHQLEGQGNAIGPSLDDVGARRDAEYIRESILSPGADISAGYEAFAALMPTNFGERMTAAQLEALVVYLTARR
jgi:cytochrome c551/c552